jgi:hypothetical protein
MSNVLVNRLEVEVNGITYGPLSAGIFDRTFEKVCSAYRSSLSGSIKDPWEDGCSVFESGMVCGAQNVLSMLHWIPSRIIYDSLIDAGFSLNIYSLPCSLIYHGRTQSVWYPGDATYVEATSLDRLVNDWRKRKVVV